MCIISNEEKLWLLWNLVSHSASLTTILIWNHWCLTHKQRGRLGYPVTEFVYCQNSTVMLWGVLQKPSKGLSMRDLCTCSEVWPASSPPPPSNSREDTCLLECTVYDILGTEAVTSWSLKSKTKCAAHTKKTAARNCSYIIYTAVFFLTNEDSTFCKKIQIKKFSQLISIF